MKLFNGRNITFVAEVKVKSPWGFQSIYTANELLQMATKIGDIVSIHTQELWGGNLYQFSEQAKYVHGMGKKVLAKGIHRTDKAIEDCIKLGADYVLTIDHWNPEFNDIIWFEPTDYYSYEKWRKVCKPDSKLVWNSRDLRTGETKTIGAETWAGGIRKHPKEYGSGRGIYKLTWDGFICRASGIRNMRDVILESPYAQAVLVGSNLPAIYAGWLTTRELP